MNITTSTIQRAYPLASQRALANGWDDNGMPVSRFDIGNNGELIYAKPLDNKVNMIRLFISKIINWLREGNDNEY